MPNECPGVPSEILNPRYTWASEEEYDKKATELATLFVNNFEKYASEASEATLAAAPKTSVEELK
ncbi:Phosphoenolpyruvate carboxykinase (ATP) [compost metagenome]